ncbi:MAG: dipeptidase PepV [Bacteroidota bacterium]
MDKLDRLVEARRDAMIRDLRELIRLESVKSAPAPGAPFGQGIRRALDFVLAKGKDLGFPAKDVLGYAGHLEFGTGDELVGVLVHLDVVPAGDGWSHPPFGGAIDGGRLYGRGAVDDKGPAVACLHAMAALAEAGIDPRRRLRLIFGCDEESGWACVDRYFAAEERPCFGFSPDAEFPLIAAEKGQMAVKASGPWTAADPAPVRIHALQGGTRANIVAETARADLALRDIAPDEIRSILRQADAALRATEIPDGLRVEARGIPAHGSTPEKGQNAIGRLLLGLAALASLMPETQAKVVRFLAERLGLSYDGAGLGVAISDGVSGPLTLNLGTAAGEADRLDLVMDIRYPVSAHKEEIIAALAGSFREIGWRVEVLKELAPLHVPADHPLVAKLSKVFTDKTGLDARPLAIGGRTYACALGTGVAFGPVFPGRPEVAHQRDEYIDLEEFMLSARIYAAAMAALIAD